MIKKILAKHSDAGILIIRVGIGMGFIFVHGLAKITSGPALWVKIGGAMGKLGISFAPTFWGFMASVSEFGGGILILLGLFTRTSSAFMAFTMLVAAIFHMSNLDPWNKVIYPVEMLSVFIALIFLGGGKYSLDNFLFGRKKQ